MRRFIFSLLLVSGLMGAVSSYACTSVIISGKVTSSGRPLMLKNRDTGELDNRIDYFRGPVYSFIGLVNSSSAGGEVWAGTNNSGFSIMNTASYNIKDDDVPESEMDREGSLMFRALGVCATVSDFERFLDNISRPMGVEANFGVIDASGGAAYYEVTNSSWIKYDVNEIECGYRVVTNFSESGRLEDYKGYERYLTASEIMKEMFSEPEDGLVNVGPYDLFYNLSRSYRHAVTGLDYLNDFYSLQKEFGFTGVVVDQDFIPRRSTSASIVFEGVVPGGDPLHTVMWTILGYPSCSVAVPLLVGDEDMVPSFMKSSGSSPNSWMCDLALRIKDNNVFNHKISNGPQYVDINSVLKLLHSCLVTESMIETDWSETYGKWVGGAIGFDTFKNEYSSFCNRYFERYLEQFASFLQ